MLMLSNLPTVMIPFSTLLPNKRPFRLSTPFEGAFVNKFPYSNKRPRFNKPHSNEDPIFTRQGSVLSF